MSLPLLIKSPPSVAYFALRGSFLCSLVFYLLGLRTICRALDSVTLLSLLPSWSLAPHFPLVTLTLLSLLPSWSPPPIFPYHLFYK